MPHTHLILFSMFTLTLTAWAHLLSLSLPHPSGTDIPYAPDVFDTEAYTFHFLILFKVCPLPNMSATSLTYMFEQINIPTSKEHTAPVHCALV